MTRLKALTAQILGIMITIGLMRTFPEVIHGTLVLLFIQAISAAIISRLLNQAAWWFIIHLCFLPSAVVLLNLPIPNHWYLFITLLLIAIYWGTLKGDVPLFLSSHAVATAIIDIVNNEHARHFADLGAGLGSITLPVAKQCPKLTLHAFEKAPLPWIIHSLRCRTLHNIKLYRRNFWTCDFEQYDVLFAFLSPVVMQELGTKVRLMMRPGSLFISSSFPVPDWEPEFIKQLNDKRKTTLYCYRIGVVIV